MKPTGRSRARLSAAVWFCMLLLVACGAPAAQRAVIGMQLEPPILDPTASPAAAISECLYGNLYEGLVQFGRDGAVLPSLAESWEISPDGMTYVFHLKHDVRFHDGSPFDATAAKFSLDRIIDAKSLNAQRSRLGAVRTVEALDPYSLRISLNRRSGGLMQTLALGAFVMVSPHSAPNNAASPVGTGPYRFASWRRGDSLTLARNPDFRGPPASLDEVTFKFISEPTAAFAALMAGDVDAFANYPAPESFAQFAADARFEVFKGTTEMEVLLSFNERIASLRDVRVRRAISYALDRHAIIDGAMYGYGTPIGSHFPPSNPAYVDLTGVYPHDLAKARALLAEAGYAHGLTLNLKLPPPSYARRGGEIIAAQLKEAGIRVEIENLEWAQWLDQVYTRHEFDMSIVGHAEPLDYDIYAREGYYFGYANPDFNALIAALDDTVDAAARVELLASIQRKLAQDAVNGFLFQYPRLAVWNKNLTGVGFDNVLSTIDVSHAHYPGGGAGERSLSAGAAEAQTRTALHALAVLILAAFAGLSLVTARRLGAVYLAKRVAVLAATLIVATALVFIVVQVVPGDPVRYMMGLQADPQAVVSMRHELGLDAAPLERYWQWVKGLLHADFGTSYTYRVPIRDLLVERLQLSLPLAVYALLLAAALAFPIGILAAARRGRPTDWVLSSLTQVGLALPNFWLGLLLVLLFAVTLHLVSAGGFPGWQSGWGPAVKALSLPALALAMPQAAILARVLRGALIDTLHEDYIRTARAKGASDWRVLLRHALPNALVPVLTILGMQFSFLLAGGVIIENVFFLPGLGRLVFQAIVQRDLIVVQSVVFVLVFAVVCVSFIVDVAHGILNPQLRGAGDA